MKKNPWKRIDFTKELGKPCDSAKVTKKIDAMLAKGHLKVVGRTKAGGRVLAINNDRFFT